MTVAECLTAYAAKIETALPGYFPDAPQPEERVLDAMRYSLLGGGKRIRGALTLAFYELLAGDANAALPYAGALEMVHAYSLIHDDLPCMDNDDLRRGKPSCHIAFGEATALLAGDGLLNLAFETMTDPGYASAFSPGQVVKAVRCLAKASGCGGMIGGQAIDLAQEGKETSDDLQRRLISKKTGALICGAGEMGCILAGADEKTTAAAVSYCDSIGLVFQIVDDILDVEGDIATLGKQIGSDAAQHKSTWVSIHGLEASQNTVIALNDQAKDALKELPGDKRFLLELVDMLAVRKF